MARTCLACAPCTTPIRNFCTALTWLNFIVFKRFERDGILQPIRQALADKLQDFRGGPTMNRRSPLLCHPSIATHDTHHKPMPCDARLTMQESDKRHPASLPALLLGASSTCLLHSFKPTVRVICGRCGENGQRTKRRFPRVAEAEACRQGRCGMRDAAMGPSRAVPQRIEASL